MAIYKDASQPIPRRIQDLLGQMTLEEKLAQLQTIWTTRQALETEDGRFVSAAAPQILGAGIGQVARPSENRDQISTNKTPAQTVNFVNAVQAWLIDNTRLGIPAIFHEEALHGHAALHATSFPQAIALASSFNPDLIEEVYAVTAEEIRRRGGSQALTPVLDVARDPRWGRFEETMGEDPYLVAVLGVAAVWGFQGREKGAIAPGRVIATLKHLAGHGEPLGGLNTAPAPVGERALREVFLFPFEAAIKVAGARSVMASYNEIDGIPSHSNRQMLTEILRQEWGFDGVVVSDYHAVKELATRHYLCESVGEAAELALKAGVDLDMPNGEAYALLLERVRDCGLPMRWIDQAVARVLQEKFLLGLFEQPFVALEGAEAFIGCDAHGDLAQKAAEQAITLLKNHHQILPLQAERLQTVAVIGPHVHETLLGGYSDVPRKTVSVLEGIKEYLGDRVRVHYAQGTRITLDHWQANPDSLAANSKSKERWNIDRVDLAAPEDTEGMIEQAAIAAGQSDLAIVVVGENEALAREAWTEEHLGDRPSLDLPGEQEALVEAVLATGTPTVLILQSGRPLALGRLAERAPAIVQAWYLGQSTGRALARVLFGDVNPCGKLPVSFPRSAGHIPAYYTLKPTAKRGYAFEQTGPLFAFGHGLSYTQFDYSALSVDDRDARPHGFIKVGVTVKNIGCLAGTETVQLYIRDQSARVTRPVQELKGFRRVHLVPGQAARLNFDLPVNLLGFYDAAMCFIVEPGIIKLMIGSASDDIRLEAEAILCGEVTDIAARKAFHTEVRVEHL